MAETIGQLALSIADGIPECCNDQLLGRTYEFEPQELETFARALGAELDKRQEPFGYFHATPFGWEDCAETDEGAVALYERPAGAVQEGWKLVPVEPTQEQLDAAMRKCGIRGEKIYSVMLDVAPNHPTAPAQGQEADRKDAERYRWLRDKGCCETLEESILVIKCKDPDFSLLPEELDAAIDAAMAAQGSACHG